MVVMKDAVVDAVVAVVVVFDSADEAGAVVEVDAADATGAVVVVATSDVDCRNDDVAFVDIPSRCSEDDSRCLLNTEVVLVVVERCFCHPTNVDDVFAELVVALRSCLSCPVR